MVGDITPVDSFYHVSKNFFDPTPSAVTWNLSIKGMVQNPYFASYRDLLAMPSVDVVVGMMCISNPIGGGLIGNTSWKGVRLLDLLNRAKPKKGVVDVALGAVDGYLDSIPLQKGLDPDVVLAYEMGGLSLPIDHGFPARLLVPGIYGMKHVKWLNSIELVGYDFKGYWQQPDQGWSDVATVRTMSQIDYPAGGTLKLKPQTFAGVAFAGDRGISKVEVSTDGGQTWNEAYIKPKLSDTSWVVWAYGWTPPAAGKYLVIVRATDGQGNLQSGRVSDPYPNGATGWHSVAYTVK
jgi:DMSO/TMAO reductase YedYZ molybdopterin-dependent catalytic subunit